MKPIAAFFLLCISITTNPIATQQQSQPGGYQIARGHGGKYQRACQRTVNRDLCIKILKSDPSSARADTTGLALIAMKAASKNASEMAKHIRSLTNNPKLAESPNQDALFDCGDYYIDASALLDDAISAVFSRAKNDVKTWVGIVIEDAQSCEASFESQPSILSQKNKAFVQICNIALALTNLTP